MHRTRIALIGTLVTCLALPAVGSAKPGLANETEINDKLLVFALANEIRKACDDISPRMLRALNYRNDLYSEARSKGYSATEIDTYIESKSERAKLKARGNSYLAQFGASLGDKASLCAVGRQEIKNRSRIGYLLRAK